MLLTSIGNSGSLLNALITYCILSPVDESFPEVAEQLHNVERLLPKLGPNPHVCFAEALLSLHPCLADLLEDGRSALHAQTSRQIKASIQCRGCYLPAVTS